MSIHPRKPIQVKHGQTSDNRTKPGLSFQVYKWPLSMLHILFVMEQNCQTWSWKLDPKQLLGSLPLDIALPKYNHCCCQEHFFSKRRKCKCDFSVHFRFCLYKEASPTIDTCCLWSYSGGSSSLDVYSSRAGQIQRLKFNLCSFNH